MWKGKKPVYILIYGDVPGYYEWYEEQKEKE